MTFRDLHGMTDALVGVFGEAVPLSELPAGKYGVMRYPRFPVLMRFVVKRYAADGFGNVFSMYTRALGGRMQLSTIAFTPNVGTDAPLLLVDVMAMGKKRAVFVEYYDLTAGTDCPMLEQIAACYRTLPDYAEKPAWYIDERKPYALIKGGADDGRLISLLTDSVHAYAEICASAAKTHAENLVRLQQFVDRMVRDGNPSSETMNRVLGRDGAEAFFRSVVMPTEYQKAQEYKQ